MQSIRFGNNPLRIAAALILLIFAILGTSVASTSSARSELLDPAVVSY